MVSVGETQQMRPRNYVTKRSVQIKVCGLTDPDNAAACADLGVDAIGLVFYSQSPRFVTDARASEIARAVAGRAALVGVFVDQPFAEIANRANRCGLTAVQLHGRESPTLVRRLRESGLTVVKALFHERAPFVEEASRYDASAFLLEWGRGRLPGGNARSWNWGLAAEFGSLRPLILAGGLTPGNVARAVALGRPAAVDVSSGVESTPGVKDLRKVDAFVAEVNNCKIADQCTGRRIFL
jgi:phosphoribosylanthranilate isomerase